MNQQPDIFDKIMTLPVFVYLNLFIKRTKKY